MCSASSKYLPLHAPVSVVSVGVSPFICFAVGNRVLASDGHSPAWLVTQLPHGAVITALEQHQAAEAAAAAPITLVIGSGDCLFASPLCANAVARFIAATGDASRVLCARSVGCGVAVLTSHNAACVLPEECLLPTAQLHVPQWSTAAGLGAALAADALRVADGAVSVFSGTYAGAIAVWRAHDAEPLSAAEVVATIAAHRHGCAVFAVRALRTDAGLCVATCSDDRSATLYHSPDGGAQWMCLWRESFSRSRVFDVAVRWDARCGALFLAAGCENGSVYGYALPSLGPRTALPLLRRSSQHSGRGAWRVALVPGALISCGFDGSVHRTPFPAAGNSAAAVVPPELRGRRHVRGVACDERGTLLACTEDALIAFLPRSEVGAVVLWRVPPSCAAGAVGAERAISRGGRAAVPTCLSAVPGAAVALVGTSAGAVYEIPYGNAGTALVPECDTALVPECGTALVPECGTALVPECGTALVPECGTALVPECGTALVPECGTALVPECGTALVPECGTALVPECGTALVPECGTALVPECGTALVPECGTALVPECGTALVPECGTALVPAGAASKALFVCGRRLGGRVVAASVHADGALFLSASGAAPQCLAHDSAGTRATALCVRAMGAQRVAVLVGDRDGGIAMALASVDADAGELLWRHEKIFSGAVAAIYVEAERVTAVSALGEWRTLHINATEGFVTRDGEAAPLQLPWSVSDVLAFHGTVAVTQFGTDVTVYCRHNLLSSPSEESGLSDWRPVAQYHDVRAPRLLRATIPEDSALPVFFCHCSDGATVEWYACDTAEGTQVLHGAETIGREYNAVVAVPSPAPPTFACGNENSMITMLREETSGASETLCGPHVSNVLALTVLPGNAVRLATAGGNATLAVWEWSASCHWCIVAVTYKKDSNQCQNGETTNCVPRFLSVCAAVSPDTIAVGGSDGLLRVFMLKNSELISKFEIIISALGAPRPITALGRVEEGPITPFLVAGDTSGSVVLCDVAKGAVVSRLSPDIHWPAQAVNAVAVDNWESEGMVGLCLCVLAAMDSGDIVLIRTSAADVVPLARLCVGLTALRGVRWIGKRRAVAVNDERIVVVGITDLGDLCIKGHRRTNVRGVSGIAVSQSGTLCVVGQGVELVSLLDSFNTN